MAGTNRTQAALNIPGPTVILVEPALSENFGTTARAMLNCGLTDLRLVNPKWVQKGEHLHTPRAIAASAGGEDVLYNTQVFQTLEAAIADLSYIIATSPRKHELIKPVYTPQTAATHLLSAISKNERIGILFGCEKSGLTNQHISLADAILEFPLNPAYTSLNLAQAVLLVGYEWTKLVPQIQQQNIVDIPAAPRQELIDFLSRLKSELEFSGFLRVEEKKQVMVQNINNMFSRMQLTSQEIRTLQGVLTYLIKPVDQKEKFKTFYAEQKEKRKLKKHWQKQQKN